jgi:hypothetical protein
MHNILLENEQIQALEVLVEGSRAQPRDARQPFRALRQHDRLVLPPHPGVPKDFPGFYPGDIKQLAREGLLTLEVGSTNTWTFEVTPRGNRYYEWLKQQQGSGVERVEQAVRSYLDAMGFSRRHPIAWEKWREAETLLWADETKTGSTTIGHLCREAHQEFAASLLARHPTPDAPDDKTRTKQRVRAVLQGLTIRSEAVRNLVTILAEYWAAVVDLAQRQEHAGLSEGESIMWEDSRRLVFQTLFSMAELDRLTDVAAVT